MVLLAVAALTLGAPGTGRAQEGTSPMRSGIERALAESAAGWNGGDLARFVAIYLDSDRTTFATRGGYLHGRATIGAYYTAHYGAQFRPSGVRDSLRFEAMEIDSLAPNVANFTAFYVLFRHDSTLARGPTSLVMQRVRGQWYIVHDHSS